MISTTNGAHSALLCRMDRVLWFSARAENRGRRSVMRFDYRGGLVLAVAALLLAASANGVLAATWHQDFNTCTGSSRPDPTWWNYDIGGGGWGNNELEY